MKNNVQVALIVCIAVCFQACTTYTYYKIRVNGFSDKDVSALNPGASVFVIENPNAENPLFEREIKSKIVKLLQKHGYRVSTLDDADYLLDYDYQIGSGRTVTGVSSHQQAGQTVAVANPTTGMAQYVHVPGKTVVTSHSSTVYGRRLLLRVVDGEQYRNTNEVHTAWVGEVTSTGRNADLREVIDYLLVAAFEYFGEDTNKAARKTLFVGDSRVKELNQ
jgi:hypothetical protein